MVKKVEPKPLNRIVNVPREKKQDIYGMQINGFLSKNLIVSNFITGGHQRAINIEENWANVVSERMRKQFPATSIEVDSTLSQQSSQDKMLILSAQCSGTTDSLKIKATADDAVHKHRLTVLSEESDCNFSDCQYNLSSLDVSEKFQDSKGANEPN